MEYVKILTIYVAIQWYRNNVFVTVLYIVTGLVFFVVASPDPTAIGRFFCFHSLSNMRKKNRTPQFKTTSSRRIHMVFPEKLIVCVFVKRAE